MYFNFSIISDVLIFLTLFRFQLCRMKSFKLISLLLKYFSVFLVRLSNCLGLSCNLCSNLMIANRPTTGPSYFEVVLFMVTLLLFKQHRLYFTPEPHGHGSFLPIFFDIL